MPEQKQADKTHIRCKVIIEVLGKPKEHVEKSLKGYVDKIKTDSELIVMNTEFADAEEKEKLWAAFAEIDMVAKGIPKLIAFCFDYMPSSIEISKPEELNMKKSTIEDFINNLQARLHDVDMIVKKLKNENDFLKKNMSAAVKNSILISLVSGNIGKETISKITGIKGEELQMFLDDLLKEKKISEDNGTYTLVRE
ncbi:MAG: hypothetical protein QF436_00100 [Candidatus Woesearchaeota archaeon]|jgi:hypothetical protein|nr:hypothetical protein [Candidatus Woesearchaeota archaeon]MDP7622507.1 hypothetical protein [Candidatus Woesearchaeota archaeon]HJN56595.1 hypothetical protein [Candidatus Woesearchaeota archaeon]|tara:strand:+ start:38325 stop:38912 length:588 start_codon:yes stop_codon:yes gene_type:complete